MNLNRNVTEELRLFADDYDQHSVFCFGEMTEMPMCCTTEGADSNTFQRG